MTIPEAKKKRQLIVAETFYSIQGEGQTAGVPAVFLRLGGCNLLCKSHDWVCDTIEVWSKGKVKTFESVLPPEYIQRIKSGAHLVITGGEPLMQQVALAEYIIYLVEELKLDPTIEIETNGTIIPKHEAFYYVEYWNVSPKLSNSGESYTKRVNEVALRVILAYEGAICYKFVVSNEGDVLEILDTYMDHIKDTRRIMLMPAGATQDELAVTRPIVADLCKQYGWRYCERIHIGIWNKKTGV